VTFILALAACGRREAVKPAGGFELTSPAFRDGEPMPTAFTDYGTNVSPPLEWRNPPEGTRSFALVFEDLGAETRNASRWIVFNIPDSVSRLPLAAGAEKDSGGLGLPGECYSGPCPTPGRQRRYRFTLYALDTRLDLGPLVVQTAVLREAMAGHVLGEAGLDCTYWRRGSIGRRLL